MYGEKELKQDIEAAFGSDLDARQLWALVNLSKRVRKYARNNAAFNNLMRRLFPYAQFSEVPKQGLRGTYTGLRITVKGESQDENEEAAAA